MTGPEPTAMLPPDIADHPPLEFSCPHCTVALEMTTASAYQTLLRFTGMIRTADQRASRMDGRWLRVRCPSCEELFDVGINAVVTVTFSAVSAPLDPKARMSGDGALLGTQRSTRDIPTVRLDAP